MTYKNGQQLAAAASMLQPFNMKAAHCQLLLPAKIYTSQIFTPSSSDFSGSGPLGINSCATKPLKPCIENGLHNGRVV